MLIVQPADGNNFFTKFVQFLAQIPPQKRVFKGKNGKKPPPNRQKSRRNISVEP
jgi:hypothetical protein